MSFVDKLPMTGKICFLCKQPGLKHKSRNCLSSYGRPKYIWRGTKVSTCLLHAFARIVSYGSSVKLWNLTKYLSKIIECPNWNKNLERNPLYIHTLLQWSFSIFKFCLKYFTNVTTWSRDPWISQSINNHFWLSFLLCFFAEMLW